MVVSLACWADLVLGLSLVSDGQQVLFGIMRGPGPTINRSRLILPGAVPSGGSGLCGICLNYISLKICKFLRNSIILVGFVWGPTIYFR